MRVPVIEVIMDIGVQLIHVTTIKRNHVIHIIQTVMVIGSLTIQGVKGEYFLRKALGIFRFGKIH